mmetsp:Transcript_13746/g.20946  ORF Transcript_13746/g.20946 Transcript_13746/m.20946 type:complete len:198 (-) Transcript_13746:204-797(-)
MTEDGQDAHPPKDLHRIYYKLNYQVSSIGDNKCKYRMFSKKLKAVGDMPVEYKKGKLSKIGKYDLTVGKDGHFEKVGNMLCKYKGKDKKKKLASIGEYKLDYGVTGKLNKIGGYTLNHSMMGMGSGITGIHMNGDELTDEKVAVVLISLKHLQVLDMHEKHDKKAAKEKKKAARKQKAMAKSRASQAAKHNAEVFDA